MCVVRWELEGREHTLGTLYQQGCPRRVMEPSMMSSATRKNACSCATAAGFG
jgi:hypothetical protein